MDTDSKKRFLVNTAFFAVIATLIYLVAKFLLSYLLPFVIGVVLAVLLQKPARKISHKTKIDTGVCAAVLVAIAYVLILLLVIIAVWQLWVHLPDFSKSITESLENIGTAIERWRTLFNDRISRLDENMANALRSLTETSFDDIISRLGGVITDLATRVAKRFPAFLISSVVTFAASCYIAKDFEGLTMFFKDILNRNTVSNIITVRDILFNRVFKLSGGYIILMFITFCELLLGFWIMKISNPWLAAALTAVVDLLPVLGTGTVLIPWAVFCFLTDNIARGAGLCALYVIITVIRNFAEPRIIGKRIGITPLVTLLTMFLGLRVAGIAGMFILPLTIITVVDFYKKQA